LRGWWLGFERRWQLRIERQDFYHRGHRGHGEEIERED
jgi:hypothetical protein